MPYICMNIHKVPQVQVVISYTNAIMGDGSMLGEVDSFLSFDHLFIDWRKNGPWELSDLSLGLGGDEGCEFGSQVWFRFSPVTSISTLL